MMGPTDAPKAPQPPQPRRVNVTLSQSGGKILIDCVSQIGQLSGGPDTITRSALSAVRNEVEMSLGMRSDTTPKASHNFNWSELAYDLVLGTVAMAHRLEPKNPDSDFREALLKRLRDANPVTKAKDFAANLEESAMSQTPRSVEPAPSFGDGTP